MQVTGYWLFENIARGNTRKNYWYLAFSAYFRGQKKQKLS
jgi:hypothetical protein